MNCATCCFCRFPVVYKLPCANTTEQHSKGKVKSTNYNLRQKGSSHNLLVRDREGDVYRGKAELFISWNRLCSWRHSPVCLSTEYESATAGAICTMLHRAEPKRHSVTWDMWYTKFTKWEKWSLSAVIRTETGTLMDRVISHANQKINKKSPEGFH